MGCIHTVNTKTNQTQQQQKASTPQLPHAFWLSFVSTQKMEPVLCCCYCGLFSLVFAFPSFLFLPSFIAFDPPVYSFHSFRTFISHFQTRVKTPSDSYHHHSTLGNKNTNRKDERNTKRKEHKKKKKNKAEGVNFLPSAPATSVFLFSFEQTF